MGQWASQTKSEGRRATSPKLGSKTGNVVAESVVGDESGMAADVSNHVVSSAAVVHMAKSARAWSLRDEQEIAI